jgi:hypothetical protein
MPSYFGVSQPVNDRDSPLITVRHRHATGTRGGRLGTVPSRVPGAARRRNQRLQRSYCLGCTVGLVTDRSGVGPIELAVLQAVDACSAARCGQYITCSEVLSRIEERTGLGPRYAYDVLVDLARSWVIAVPTIDAAGNIGDREFPASAPRHVQCRASRAGQAILDAEAGRLAPVPAGLINGTAYRGGTQPPLEPARVIAALRHILDHPGTPDRDILAIAGPPFSVTGATVTGDLDALAAGQQIMLRQTGRITLTGHPIPEPRPRTPPAPGQPRPTMHVSFSSKPDPQGRRHARAQLLIESLPPDAGPGQVTGDLADPATARDQLAALDGITTCTPAALPAPLATLLRTWTSQHHTEDITASLTRLAADTTVTGE